MAARKSRSSAVLQLVPLLLRGAYVETHARGTHRIKGGSVQIN
ncbi:hypothetical protein [Nannocystis punicea]|uniref:Uncharacterized protein n=1 Tax=Nannocystis punicea TaxID=2995304 RepID=A0ABY7HFI2_9BACT|nr:hypothetical protein [Nannocystis poenicansa]WAS98033.1 hypothetical protein O0S08_17975 [Nannocystis poenicansa]